MITRNSIVTTLSKSGFRPNVPDYAYHVTKLMVKEFKVDQKTVSKQDLAKVEKEATNFAYKVRAKYVTEFKYNYEKMLDKKKKWFSEVIKNPIEKPSPPSPKKTKKGRKIKTKRGPKTKPYLENKAGGTQQWKKASESNKKKDYSLEQLIHMTLLKAKETGNKDCAFVMKKLKENPELNASEIRNKYENPVKPVIVLTPKECLAEVLQGRMSQRSYKRMRKKQKASNAKIFVSWEDILKAKKECKPEGIDDTTKIGVVSVPMQKVCDHQISKIMDFPEVKEKCQQLNESGRQYKLVMYGKYGADGTTTDAEYQTADAGEFSF